MLKNTGKQYFPMISYDFPMISYDFPIGCTARGSHPEHVSISIKSMYGENHRKSQENNRKIIGNHKEIIGNYKKIVVFLRFFDNY